ncbi:MAG: thiolase family protein [Planctomycetales bacterium]
MPEAVIVGGVRTPFARAAAEFNDIPAQDLGRLAVRELLDRFDLDPAEVDELIAGNVASPIDAANVSRVIALRAGIPRERVAHTVNRNCASGMEAVTEAVERVESGAASCIVALGVDSMSNIPVYLGKGFTNKLLPLSRAKSLLDRLKVFATFRPSDLKPIIGVKVGLTDPVSGMMMGDTAERLAREFDISRARQDEFALKSHRKAVAAWESGRLAGETMTVYTGTEARPVAQDTGPRADQSLDKLAKLRPYFDPRWGTVTVGNACGVTDGAAALLVMSADKARALGYEPLGRIRGYAYAGCDPSRMGLGPVFATARALESTKMRLDEMELIELNEAFAAQVLACLEGFRNPERICSAEDGAGRLGPIDEEQLNVNGGAIALGHPVGATGARLVLTLLNELARRDQNVGLATLCVGGGQGAAVVVERLGKAA